jgi:hypothetical protein
MSLMQNRWFRRFGFGAIAALSLFAATMTTSGAAQARGIGGMAVAHHMAYFHRGYVGYGGGYWHPWYHHWR